MKQGLHIFVVDDSPACAYTLAEMLREHGHLAVPYTDPRLALADARNSVPDVLISDIEMPHVDGVQLALMVLERCPDCKVVLMSGRVGPIRTLQEALSKGHQFAFFEKPLASMTLFRQLERYAS